MLLTDNIELKYKFYHKNWNAHQAVWISFLSEYDFEIGHIKGKEDIEADALSQKQHEMNSILVSEYESEFKNMLKMVSSRYDEYKELMEICKTIIFGNKNSMYHIDTKVFCVSKIEFMYQINLT